MKIGRSGCMVSTVLITVAITFLLAPTSAQAQAREKSFIRFIVPNAPGSGIDTNARSLSDGLAKALGKPVAVENLPGAGGIRGIQEIVSAPKDGYTIGLTGNNIAVNPSMYKDLSYDALRDLTWISLVGTESFVLVTSPTVPAKDVKELIALAKSQPGKLNYGSSGNGTVLHLAAELFCSEAGVKITHVPYKGGSQLMTDLLGGHMDMAFMGLSQCVQQVKAGKLRALGVSAVKRSPALPDVPALAEAGLPNYSYGGWFVLIGPANLSQAIVKRLSGAVQETVKSKETRDVFAGRGADLIGSTSEEAARFFEAELAKNTKLCKQAGVNFPAAELRGIKIQN